MPVDPALNDVPIDAGIGGYLRWRERMVRLSVLQDLKTTLTATGWMNSNLSFPFEVKEFFPEFQVYAQDDTHVNTLVLDEGEPMQLEEWDMGNALTRIYRFNVAFYAENNETGVSVFSDLSDRFDGITDAPYVSLFNYNAQGSNYPLITRMEVESFQFVRAPLDASPYEHHLFFGELLVRDFIDGNRTVMQP
jgi:hypothetical protein